MLDVKTGTVIGETHRRHRAVEFRKFLDHVDGSVPADLDVHIIMDNYPMFTKLTADFAHLAGISRHARL